MRGRVKLLAVLGVGVVTGFLVADKTPSVQGQGQGAASVAAVPGQKGGWDLTGPYDVVRDWPKPLSNLPGHEKWTWGSVQSVFAESPDRIYILQRGELPKMNRPQQKAYPEVGPSLSFPVGGVPWRNASQGSVSSPPGAGAPGADPDDPAQAWRGRLGVDARWEHCLVVVNAAGDIIEEWTEWDKMFRRPHAVYINPYDAQKHVWVVDDHNQAIFKFTHDGKQLVQTIGTVGKAGADATHFNRPTFLAWLPDSTMFVADGYNGNRVVKFDKDGKFLLAWGEKGTPPETRPGYFNTVHGIAVDPVSRRVYVSDRSNRRIQVFDENGKFVDQWPTANPSNPNFLIIPADRSGLWVFDDTSAKIVKFDLEGRYLYSWGAQGDFPGGFFNLHGAGVDQDGNLYTAEVAGGRPQKFRPRPGANPAFLVGKPVYAAWK